MGLDKKYIRWVGADQLGAIEQKTRRSRCKKQKATSKKYIDENCSEGKGRRGNLRRQRERGSQRGHGMV